VKRRLLTAVLAAAALAAAAGTAAARPQAGLQQAKLLVSVSGYHDIVWTEDSHLAFGNCDHTTKEDGGGSEHVRFSVKQAKLLAVRAAPATPALFRWGSWNPSVVSQEAGAKAVAAVHRESATHQRSTFGSCHQGSNVEQDVRLGAPYDCGDRTPAWDVVLGYDEGSPKKLALAVVDQVVQPLGKEHQPYDNCRIEVPTGPGFEAEPFGITKITTDLPSAELFTYGKEIVIADKVFPLKAAEPGAPHSSVHVHWQATFTRVK